MKDITPPAASCVLTMSCPAIFDTGRGTYIIVGKTVTPADHGDLKGRVGEGEGSVEVPAELLGSVIRSARYTLLMEAMKRAHPNDSITVDQWARFTLDELGLVLQEAS